MNKNDEKQLSLFDLRFFYSELAKANSTVTLDLVSVYIERLLSEGFIEIAGNIYIILAKHNRFPRALEEAVKCAEALMNGGGHEGRFDFAFSFSWRLARYGIPRALEEAVKCAEALMNEWRFDFAWSNYMTLARTGGQKCINAAIKWVEILIVEKQFYDAWRVCVALMEINTSESRKWAMKWWNLLIKHGKLFDALDIYLRYLIEIKPVATEIKKEVSNAKVLIVENRILEALETYQKLQNLTTYIPQWMNS